MKLFKGELDHNTNFNHLILKQSGNFHINTAHLRFTPYWKKRLCFTGPMLRHWFRWFSVAKAVLTPLPKTPSYPLEVFFMLFLPYLARLDGSSIHPPHLPSEGMRQSEDNKQVQVGHQHRKKIVKLGIGSQWNKLFSWVTSWPTDPDPELPRQNWILGIFQ